MGPSSQGTVVPKEDPGKGSGSVNASAAETGIPVKVKKEDLEEDRVDAALAIFDDVDDNSEEEGPELVDIDHVGFVDYKGVNCWVCPGFRIPQIPEVSVVKRPLKDLCNAIGTNDIILDPDYQRDIVWDDMRAEGLIVSLLMGYLPPPIIFNVKLNIIETANGKLKKHIRTCVDGKQRLTSILRFMRGEIGFLDSKHKKWYYEQPIIHGKKVNGTHNILPTDMKGFFMSRFFICYEYNELSQSTEEEMFQLVQRGIALTPAEKMRAMSTEWAKFARQYEEDYSMIINLSKQGRASGFRLTLTIFAMVQEIMSNRRKSTSVPTLQASPQALTRMLEEKQPINPVLKLKMKSIFDRYETLVKLSSTRITTTRYRVNADSAFDTAPNFLRGDGFDHVRTFSPLELISAGLLVCYHMDTRTDDQLLNDVKEMRRHLRVKHKDLRVNAQCWATVWEFIVGIGNSNSTTPETTEAIKPEATRRKRSAASASFSAEVAKKFKRSADSRISGRPINSRSSPPGEGISRSGPRAKTTGNFDINKGNLKDAVPDKYSVSNDTVSENSSEDAKINEISALGKSGAGYKVTTETNGMGHTKGTNDNGPNSSREISKDNDVTTSRVPARFSAITATNTVGMSTRVTRGRTDSAIAKKSTRDRVKRGSPRPFTTASHKSDAAVEAGPAFSFPAKARNEKGTNGDDLEYIDGSDSSESLSSAPSTIDNNPPP